MPIREYHQHHSLRDEEDLFHSSLSEEFDNRNTRRSGSNSRPWLTRTRRDDREPYELLDDVPPADLSDSRAAAAAAAALAAFGGVGPPREGTSLFPELLDDDVAPADSTRGATTRVDNRNGNHQFQARREVQDLFPDGLLPENPIENDSRPHAVVESEGVPSDYQEKEKQTQGQSRLELRLRYPVEELYPNDNNDVIMGYCDDDRTNYDHEHVEYEIGDEDDYYSHMQYSEPIVSDDYKKTQAPSRYPIDDDGYCTDEEGKTTARRGKKVVWYDEQPRMDHKFDVDDAMVISPSASDDEVSVYRPMHLHSTSPSDRSRFFDGNDEHASSNFSDDNKSTGTFDRLYDEEYSSIYSTPMERSDNHGNAKTVTPSSYTSPIKEEKDSSLLPRLSPEDSPDSVLDTPGSTPGSFLGDVYGPTQEDLRASTETIERIMNQENIERTDQQTVNQSPNRGGSDGAPTPLRSNRNNVRPSGRSHPVNEPGGDTITKSVESSPVDTDIRDEMEVDGSPKSCKTESPQSSPGFDSDDDSAIQDLARLMHMQQRQHRQQEGFTNQGNHYHQVPHGDGHMSRLEQWQQKQQLLQQQLTAASYLPTKYLQQKQKYPPKLEPEDTNPRDPDGVRYYGGEGENNLFPDLEWDDHGNLTKGTVPKQRTQVVAAPFLSPSPKDNQDHHDFANVSMVSSATQRVKHPASHSMASNTVVSAHDTWDRSRIYRAVQHHHVPDELSLLESYDDYSNDEALPNSSNSMQDDVSVISEDTQLRLLAQQVPAKQKLQQQQRLHPYTVKRKDSMESGMKLELDEEEARPHSYNVIKRNDSMEEDMVVLDFDEEVLPTKHTMKDFPIDDLGVNIIEYDDKSIPGTSVISPPPLKRQQFSFTENIEEEEDEDPIIPLKSYSDESEATNDPAIFPTRAVFQMNLSQHSSNKEGCESSDLVERACEFLARGRNEDALQVLNEALDYAQASLDSVKQVMDVHYYNKKRGLRPPNSEQLLSQEEYEGKLNADFRKVASEMADIINNIGVVHELNGDYHLAMNSFRDALDVYRRMCHRYENSGDADVDRTVTNIMHMGIAMRSRDKREELHLEAEDLAAMIDASDDPDERMELRIERLNILMSVVDVENESLGRNHPTVGFTLLKKGKLHLEMKHIDLAVNDIQEAITILKNGLGNIHPAVGGALLFLADIYNYQGLYDPVSDKKTALKLYQEAVIALSASYGNINADLGLAYNSMGIIHGAKGENELAMKSFYNALAGYGVRAKGADSSKGKTHPDVAFVWMNVGDLHMEEKEWQLALRSYLKAHSALRNMDEDHKNSLHKIGPKRMARSLFSRSKGRCEDNEALLAFALSNIAKAQSMLQKYGKSIEVLEEALRIHRVIDMRCQGAGRPNSWSKDIARILENLGEVQMASGNVTSAFDCYVESLNRLRASNGASSNSIEVALVLGAIGHVHMKKGEYAEATVILKECMRTFEQIGVPPNNRRYKEVRSTLVDAELALMQNSSSTLASQRLEISEVKYVDKALACDEIADAYKNKDDISAAIWFYSEALSLRREKLQRASGSLKESEMVDIGKTISTIAQLRLRRREFEAAKILFEEAKHFYKTVGLSSQHPFYRDLTGKIEELRKS
ncbi:hypothetical protein ACHAWX_006978 [Stephanocyclus meneghinianus]